MMRVLNLYTTLGCHLCDEAAAIINELINQQEIINLRLVAVEISDSDTLMEKYAVRIPVLKFQEEIKELAWPCTDEELSVFLL